MDNGASSYRRFLDGDDYGMEELVRDYKDGLILYLNSYLNDFSIAEDCVQDTFIKLAIKKPKFNGKSSFKTWLYTIGRNVAIDYLRNNLKNNEVSIDENAELIADENAVESAYIKKEQKIIVHKAMRKLPQEYQQVLWLVYFEELSNKETAKIMKKSVRSIESLLYRARKSLRSQLEMEGFDYEKL